MSPKCVVGLWPTFDTRTENPLRDCPDLERRRKNRDPVQNRQQGHGDTNPRCSGVAMRGGG